MDNVDLSILQIKNLVNRLNVYRDAYYNESKSIVSDYEYDKLFDELIELENKTGFIMSNSPTQTVGYPVAETFNKVIHDVPLLSLDKTQNILDFISFCKKNDVLLMHKLDGLTIELIYNQGELVQASTRGNGIEGDDITENAKYFDNIPLKVNYKKSFKVIGEAIITKDVFERINKHLSDDKKFKNARNLASGTVKNLNTKIVSDRHIKFICWNANDLSADRLMSTGLKFAHDLGFDIVDYYIPIDNLETAVPDVINTLKRTADAKFIPIDGIVAVYNDIKYGESLGKTAHHFNNGFAFKFYDEEESSILRDVEWSMGKTGDLTPVAIFDTVEIDGTSVSRALLHNISIVEKLKLGIGDNVLVYKANQIIPQIRRNLTESNTLEIPKICPICGDKTIIVENKSTNGIVKVLRCTNNSCQGKLLGKLCHFVSKEAMNIDGLSEATITKFIELGLLSSITDIYNLNGHRDTLLSINGFGETSVDKLFIAIEKSKHTTLNRLINALSIPNIGKSESKTLSKFISDDVSNIFNLQHKDLTVIEGFGDKMNNCVHEWFNNMSNINVLNQLLDIVIIDKPTNIRTFTKLHGIGFVITGKLEVYPNRSALESDILHNGGILQSSVTNKTNFLINNDIESSSSKNKKAKELHIPIISERQFIEMIADDVVNSAPIATEDKTNNSTKSNRNKLF
jgi:DNA ligase (NAD+)